MHNRELIRLISFRLISFLLHYLSYFPLTFFTAELLTITLMSIINTKLEPMFFLIVSYTPTLDLWGKSSFSLRIDDIMQFFVFWSFIVMVIHYLFKKFLKIRIRLKYVVLIFTILHIAAIFQTRSNGTLPIIIFFYISSVASLSIYLLLNKLSSFIRQNSGNIEGY